MRFANFRLIIFLVIVILSATVLGISSNFAKIFLPNYHHDFTIMTLVASALTIFMFLVLFQWSQPKIELPVMILLDIYWLAVASFTADIMSTAECDSLGNQTVPGKLGNVSARGYCYQMKIIEAFSFTITFLLLAYWIILINLTSKAEKLGDESPWSEPIVNLPWFSDTPYDHQARGGYPNYPGGPERQTGGNGFANGGRAGSHRVPPPQGPQMGQGYYPSGPVHPSVQQNPGHQIIVQPGHKGRPTTVQQVPLAQGSIV